MNDVRGRSGDTGEARDECVIVAPYYHPEIIGSAPYCTELAEWLAGRGRRVRVLTARPRYPNAAAFPSYRDGARDREQIGGVDVVRVPVTARRGNGAAARLRADLSFALGGLAAIFRGRIASSNDVITFVPTALAVPLGFFLKRRAGRLVVVVHDIESGLAKSLGMMGRAQVLVRAVESLERFLLNRADSLVVLTAQMEHALRANGVKVPITVLPIWAAPAPAPAPRAGRATPVLMYSGALGRKQGLHSLIELAERLNRTHPAVRVIIQGEGGEKAELEREIQARRLDNVELRPLVPKERLLDALREADIHLVPQDARAADYAVPSKIATIMSAARSFVCTADGGTALDELVRETGAGVCVPTGDPEGFYGAVVRLIETPALRDQLGTAGLRYVQERLAAPRILQQYEALLRGPPVCQRAGMHEIATPT